MMPARKISRSLLSRTLVVGGMLVLSAAVGAASIWQSPVVLAATIDKVLASSWDASNRGMQWELKDYAVNMSRYKANGGSINMGGGYDNTSSTCSHPASIPWLPSNSSAYEVYGDVFGYPKYNGNDLGEKGNCSKRYSDGGTNSGSWLPPSYLNWTQPGTIPGFGVVSINSSVNVDCNGLLGGGNPPLISRRDTSSGFTDQAYGPGGIFSTIWGASPPTGALKDVRLYSYGTGLIRNQFTLTAEEYAEIDPTRGNAEVYLYARGDDWINMYVNGVRVGSTSSITGTVVKSSDLRAILKEGTNIIALQVHDKAHWRDSNNIAATTGACYNLTVHLPSDTTVSPQVSLTASGVAIAGQAATAAARIDNDGGIAGRANWQRTLWYSHDSGTSFGAGDQMIRNESGTVTVPIGGHGFSNWNTTIDAGYSYICTRLQLSPANAETKVSPAARSTCLPIGKQPHIQASGGDVFSRSAGSIIHAPAVHTSSGVYGSWAEYGIFGTSGVDMYSGGALMATVNPAPGHKSRLTFANQSVSGPGHFASTLAAAEPTLPQWGSEVMITTSSVNVGSLQNKRTSRHSGNLTLTSSADFTKSAVLIVDGTVTINSNIRYTSGPFSQLSDIPQLIIVANQINIPASVERIDAWLIARSGLVTCGTSITTTPYFSGLREGVCADQLRVNGPVRAERLLLRRTAGAEGTTPSNLRQPAEAFNLRPDAYLWAYGQASGGNTIRTETIKELPPRF